LTFRADFNCALANVSQQGRRAERAFIIVALFEKISDAPKSAGDGQIMPIQEKMTAGLPAPETK